MKQCLLLTRSTRRITWFTVPLDLSDMTPDCFPTLDLASILFWQTTAQTISQYHWNQPRGSSGWIQPLFRHADNCNNPRCHWRCPWRIRSASAQLERGEKGVPRFVGFLMASRLLPGSDGGEALS